ncbi:DivIVA domain-containing protein [Pseudoclavibacter sp. 13-3]|uniref:DivIVA domain-containing protein n=1 Tax=Pseudoclavibacter sp. 13-3 TaxID=2901228 RepID=UPI001E620B50|nr:DivIVA domain-containing protein [Pseudoclavibacter sp. 13-3]MCD7102318.1 DivIVA domain-containing protein [Pseudoclavibacter sp. 13-3]
MPYASAGSQPGTGRLTSPEVLSVRFRLTRFKPGYAQAAVDDFLDEVAAYLQQIERGEETTATMSSDRLRSVRFPIVRFQPGYAQDAVDDFLDDVAARLPLG